MADLTRRLSWQLVAWLAMTWISVRWRGDLSDGLTARFMAFAVFGLTAAAVSRSAKLRSMGLVCGCIAISLWLAPEVGALADWEAAWEWPIWKGVFVHALVGSLGGSLVSAALFDGPATARRRS